MFLSLEFFFLTQSLVNVSTRGSLSSFSLKSEWKSNISCIPSNYKVKCMLFVLYNCCENLEDIWPGPRENSGCEIKLKQLQWHAGNLTFFFLSHLYPHSLSLFDVSQDMAIHRILLSHSTGYCIWSFFFIPILFIFFKIFGMLYLNGPSSGGILCLFTGSACDRSVMCS